MEHGTGVRRREGHGIKRHVEAVDSHGGFKRSFQWEATRTGWLGYGGTVAAATAAMADGGEGVACACVRKIPIDKPALVKMPKGWMG